MIRAQIDAGKFINELNNVADYMTGFLQGVESGQRIFSENLGREAIEDLKNFIDANARLSPETLHHVYEWYQTGSPEARLFDIDYVAHSNGLSFNSTFRQSISIRKGSTVPFYNKAEIMENGLPVHIRPRQADVLVFEDGGQTVFTKKPVNVTDPGGSNVQGGYERTFNLFFEKYFSQSFLQHSQVLQRLRNATPFYTNFYQSTKGGRSAGVSVGRKWISGGVV